MSGEEGKGVWVAGIARTGPVGGGCVNIRKLGSPDHRALHAEEPGCSVGHSDTHPPALADADGSGIGHCRN